MGEIGFLRWRDATVDVRVDGQPRRVVRLGVPWRLTRYATAPMTALWNENTDGPVAVDDAPEVAALSVERNGRTLSVDHTPPVPDLDSLTPGTQVGGRVEALVGGQAQFGGTWQARRVEDRVELGIDIDQPWDPGTQPTIAAAVFDLLRVFRTWPTTYRWLATIDLTQTPPTMRSRWERTS